MIPGESISGAISQSLHNPLLRGSYTGDGETRASMPNSNSAEVHRVCKTPEPFVDFSVFENDAQTVERSPSAASLGVSRLREIIQCSASGCTKTFVKRSAYK